MQRSAALTPLSHDHHQALFAAHALRRSDADTATAARGTFLAFWAAHGRRHFRIEEEVLLPGAVPHVDAHDALVLQVLGDHVAIRARAVALAASSDVEPDELRELGELLAAHVRREERELFPRLEAALPDDALAALGEAIAAAEAA